LLPLILPCGHVAKPLFTFQADTVLALMIVVTRK